MKIFFKAILLLGLFVHEALAQNSSTAQNVVEVNIFADFTPKSIIGLLFNSKGSIQKLKLEYTRYNDFIIVKIPYQESEIDGESMASAVAFADDGRLAFADVKPISIPALRKSFLSLPACSAKPKTNAELAKISANLGVFESLLEIRSSRKEVAKLKLASILKDELLIKLRRLERGFGLESGAPLSAELPADQLVDRLFRLLNAINSLSEH